MTKGVKRCLILVIMLFIASAVAMIFVNHTVKADIVEIIRDGEVLYTFDLADTDDQIIKIEYENNGYNVIEITDGTIKISTADCPDHICVKTGTLKSAGMPIVCLPHHLIIRYIDES